MIWQIWWVWVVAGIGFGILEIFAPGFFFLGFGIGAALAGGAVEMSSPLSDKTNTPAPTARSPGSAARTPKAGSSTASR